MAMIDQSTPFAAPNARAGMARPLAWSLLLASVAMVPACRESARDEVVVTERGSLRGKAELERSRGKFERQLAKTRAEQAAQADQEDVEQNRRLRVPLSTTPTPWP